MIKVPVQGDPHHIQVVSLVYEPAVLQWDHVVQDFGGAVISIDGRMMSTSGEAVPVTFTEGELKAFGLELKVGQETYSWLLVKQEVDSGKEERGLVGESGESPSWTAALEHFNGEQEVTFNVATALTCGMEKADQGSLEGNDLSGATSEENLIVTSPGAFLYGDQQPFPTDSTLQVASSEDIIMHEIKEEQKFAIRMDLQGNPVNKTSNPNPVPDISSGSSHLSTNRKQRQSNPSNKYQCRRCGNKFKTKKIYEVHYIERHNPKPFRCKHPGCPKAFARDTERKSHEASRVHKLVKDKVYCSVCQTALTPKYLDKHMMKKHPKN